MSNGPYPVAFSLNVSSHPGVPLIHYASCQIRGHLTKDSVEVCVTMAGGWLRGWTPVDRTLSLTGAWPRALENHLANLAPPVLGGDARYSPSWSCVRDVEGVEGEQYNTSSLDCELTVDGVTGMLTNSFARARWCELVESINAAAAERALAHRFIAVSARGVRSELRIEQDTKTRTASVQAYRDEVRIAAKPVEMDQYLTLRSQLLKIPLKAPASPLEPPQPYDASAWCAGRLRSFKRPWWRFAWLRGAGDPEFADATRRFFLTLPGNADVVSWHDVADKWPKESAASLVPVRELSRSLHLSLAAPR
jgi:hypothetical protein